MSALARAAALIVVLAALAPAAVVGDEHRAPPANPTWQAECGACHVPYPPRRLPARSWRAVMGSLDRHFGVDASLDAQAAGEIAAFLERHAGRDRGGDAPMRITETAWFRREHRKIPAAVWTGPGVKSAANCGVCHPAADRGHYDDDTVRVPR
jgi:hypothetical protein